MMDSLGSEEILLAWQHQAAVCMCDVRGLEGLLCSQLRQQSFCFALCLPKTLCSEKLAAKKIKLNHPLCLQKHCALTVILTFPHPGWLHRAVIVSDKSRKAPKSESSQCAALLNSHCFPPVPAL